MDYKTLYENQYGKKQLISVTQKQFFGLRRTLKKYDWDRYTATDRLIKSGNRVLDIGCGDSIILRKINRRFEELYGLDVAPSRLQEAEEKVKQIYPSDYSKFNFIEGNGDNPLPFHDCFLML